jgi:hypothetical protein
LLTLQKKTKGDYSSKPESAYNDGNAIEVSFHNGRSAIVGRDATAKKIGKASAFAFVEKN